MKDKQILEKIKKVVVALNQIIVELGDGHIDSKELKQKLGKTPSKIYAGPSGGVILLAEKGFFKTPKTAYEVCSSLGEHNYVYKRSVVQTALNRHSKHRGILVSVVKDGKKAYVERK